MIAPFRQFSLLLGLLLAAALPLSAQSYGLTQRPSVGPNLDGVFPPQPPILSGNWSTVVAFPNLTFLNPVGLTHLPGTNRLVVWEREGRVYHFENNPSATTKTLMIDVSAVCQGWDDSGLLGLAFHPDFVNNRYVFIWYNWRSSVLGNANSRPPSNTATRNRLSRFTLDANGVAVAGSETIFIDQVDVSVWHNGGGMFFHPQNGFLYITNGDDTNTANSQRINTSLFGGVLRIDVDRRGGTISHAPPKRSVNEISPAWPLYFVPKDNPWVGVPGALEEFYAIGLRSPHRMTIDPVTGRIFIGDVGGGSREEISVIEPTDPPGLNFQWPNIEGYGGDLPPTAIGTSKRPIIDYGRGDGSCIIGGYVYRGQEFAAELGGKYIFADNINGRIWVLDESTHTATTPASKILLTQLPNGPGPNPGNNYVGLSSFGTDANGELYICQMSSTAGRIYKLQRGGTPSAPLPATLSQTGAFSNLATLAASSKLIPYAINAPFWSDRAVKSRWAAIPNQTTVGFTATGDWSFPTGSVFVKHFDLPVDDLDPSATRRLETRFLVKMDSGAVYGATYKWRDDYSDADLLADNLTENVPVGTAPLGATTSQDIGAPALAGSTQASGREITIQAGGTDIWGTSDQFHFAHQQRTGDFDFSVRIDSLSTADLYTKAGLMARESLAANARHVYALVFPSNASRNNNVGGYEFQYRTTTGGTSTAIYPAAPQPRVNYPNTYLRLRREGNTFISYWSHSGIEWTEFARHTIALPQTVYFGLAVTSHTATARTTARFSTTRLQPWYYPSRQDCTTCHVSQVGGVLGLSTRQLNKVLNYPSGVTDNQIRSWNHVGLFSNGPAESSIPNLGKLAHLDETAAPLDVRARSYLDSNCAYCHRPGGVQAFWDGRFETPLASQGIINGNLVNTLGIPGAKVVVPQDLAKSVLHVRVNQVGAHQMPPIARNLVDRAGSDLLAAWIQSIVPDGNIPLVQWLAPASGSTIERFAKVRLRANATHAEGIDRVEFYDGASLLGQAALPPYQIDIAPNTAGARSLRAVAYNPQGWSGESDPVTLNVAEPPTNFAIDVNFQPAGAPVPQGYHVDAGATYGPRGNGFTYGWSRDNTADTRDRDNPASPDQRYDTLIHLQKPDGLAISYWEIAAPNGLYDVQLAAGDPSNSDGYMELQVENQILVSGAQSQAGQFLEGQALVNVTDGRITIAPGPNAVNAKLCFVRLRRLLVAPHVDITGIADGTALVSTDPLTFSATASDMDGTVSRVEFFINGIRMSESFAQPHSFAWPNPLPAGIHTLTAIAYDNDGRSTTSFPITVHIFANELHLVGLEKLSATQWLVRLGNALPAGRAFVIDWSPDMIHWNPIHAGSGSGGSVEISHSIQPAGEGFFRMRLP
jgi:glucose/arabinose dehydrogenase/mono/diheme cytochrome c family protein